ncbi:MAG: 50S ribosomal protein L2 [Methanophagales archaeon ANME-1-THS]|nr:MAG: 50S ribosomal protein L2 [Methanophagales archaeon ANME-1-THS]
MGKRIIAQRRGRGSSTFRAPSHRYKGNLEHVRVNKNETVSGRVVEILHDPARSAPIARITMERTDNGQKHEEERFIIIPEGIGEGDSVSYGEAAAIKTGNTVPLRNIPEGITICNIEARPNDGGKFVRSSGGSATVLAHEQGTGQTLVVLPSGQKKWLSSDCFATIGVVAGGGRTEKPFVKAGKKYHKMKAHSGKYPKVRGVAMNPVDHPHGGGSHQHVGKPKTPGRGAPPGRKVGSIAARRTGRK